MKDWLKVFQSRKMAALLLLGFSSGLPLYLTSRTLQAWMTQEKVSLGVVGAFSLVSLPYSLKFLWSPIIDRYVPPFLGRRRGWMAITQIGLIIAIAAMSTIQNPTQALQFLAINALIIAFLSATQDIAFDAYRTDILSEIELGAGASIGVLGYRVALLVTSALALILADSMPWQVVYLLMAILMGIGLSTSFWAPDTPAKDTPPNSIFDAVYLPFQEFFQRLGITESLLILVFILLYRLGDSLLGNMVTPFLLQIGFSQTNIGAIQGGMGFLATTVGVLAGGAILTRIGLNKSLWVFGILQAVSNLGYYILAVAGKDDLFLVLAINIENFCGGLVLPTFVAFLMNLCNHRFSATQFALLSSLMAISRDIVVAPAGILAEKTGWPLFFLFSLVAAVPGMLFLPKLAPWGQEMMPIPHPPDSDRED